MVNISVKFLQCFLFVFVVRSLDSYHFDVFCYLDVFLKVE